MKKTQLRNSLFLFIAAFIWGTAFVAQSAATDSVGGFTFTAMRSIVATLFLIPVAIISEKVGKKNRESDDSDDVSRAHMIGPFTKAEVIGGIVCGISLFAASSLQQFGIAYTSVAKAGFITALYVILVPILGVFIGHKFRPYILACAGLSLVGMFFLCLFGKGAGGFNFGDTLELICAFVFAVQILSVSHYSTRSRGVILSLLMFFVSSILGTIFMFVFEEPSLAGIQDAIWSILYVGIFSSGVAYTLQIFGEKNLNPALASLIMCLESVISAISGWIILGQAMSGPEIFGGALMFIAIVVAQVWPLLHEE